MLKRSILAALAVLPLVAIGVAAPAEAGWRRDLYGNAYYYHPWHRHYYRSYGFYGGGLGYPHHHWHPYGYGWNYGHGGY